MDEDKVIRNSDYPSNKREKKTVEKVIKGKVKQKKKSLGEKFVETFIGEEPSNIVSYILQDVIVPTIKDTIVDSVKGSVEMLFGTRRSNNSSYRNRRTGSYVHYESSSIHRDNIRPSNQQTRSRASHKFDDFILDTREEAEEVLSNLADLIFDYGSASVSDLYDLLGVTSSFVDNKYGWVNLTESGVSRVREGYRLNLPKTVLLD